MNYYLTAVNSPFNKSILVYYSEKIFEPGDLIVVPLGKRKVSGCLLKLISDDEAKEHTPLEKVKAIISLSDESIRLSLEELKLYEWMSQYYHYPLGMLIFGSLPKFLKRPRDLRSIEGQGEELDITLTQEQDHVLNLLSEKIRPVFSKSLLHGITGSGKTIIYIMLMKKTLEQKKSVLFLLPEINLTSQFVATFQKYLNTKIYTYNSSVTNSDKYGLWKLLNEERTPKVIIGVRSSIFLPIRSLGLIIVDEEHDQSFKQDDRCPYNARDLAIKKSSLLNIPIILGSATPSLETFANFYRTDDYLTLKKRPLKSRLPNVELIDMREKEKDVSELWPFHSKSISLIQAAFERGEQVLVFINKLGYASFMQCRSCGHQFECPNCHTNLRVHKEKNRVHCHVCDHREELPSSCPVCGNMSLLNKGFGTEKVKEVLESIFPGHNIARFDRDEITSQLKLEDRLKDFHSGKIDLLVGTQMMSKGHNFERVNTVLILGIDSQLNFPDFRANERVFQTLYQVSGRSGRFGRESRVAVQTLAPDNKIFTYILTHEFDAFYHDEMTMREICECPPYAKIAMIYFTANKREKVVEIGEKYRGMAQQLKAQHFAEVDVLGPRPAFIEKRVNRFTWSSMVKSSDLNQLHNFIKSIETNLPLSAGVSYKIDVDPLFIE